MVGDPVDKLGLIPAWAGKTIRRKRRHGDRAAHPRVGGENHLAMYRQLAQNGSSPRGRGKPGRTVWPGRRAGLIPAWAGKTCVSRALTRRSPAHPRVGGENPDGDATVMTFHGSSPRGRGKPRRRGESAAHVGLIPAWAGKTRFDRCV